MLKHDFQILLEVHPAKLWAHIDANKAVREPVLAMSAQLHGWKALSVEKYTFFPNKEF